MMKKEFEDLIVKKISNEDYEIIEQVYLDYPGIGTNGKQVVANLYNQFGLVIFKDMLPRAQKVNELMHDISIQQQILNDIVKGGVI